MDVLKIDIGQFKGGARAAFDRVYRYYSRSLTHFALSYVHRRELAEELVSDSMLKLWNHRGEIEKASQIKAFLFIVTKNACIDALRSQKVSPVEQLPEVSADLASEDPEIYTRILYAELLQQIENAIVALPKSQQLVIRKWIFENKSTGEIMSETGMTASSIFTQKSKALHTLRDLLKNNSLFVMILCVRDINFPFSG